MTPPRRRRKRDSRARRWRYRSAYGVLRAVVGLFSLLPFEAATTLGRFLGTLAYYVVWTERRRVLEHLRSAFGESLSVGERRRIARAMFGHMGHVVAEMVHIPRLTPEELRRRVRIADEAKYRAAVERAKTQGVIYIGAHLGSWEWVVQHGRLVEGMGTLGVAREISNPWVHAWFERVRQSHGVEIVYRKRAGLATLRALRDGKGVGILLDQCTKGEGAFVPFFGRPAHTLTGPARLALRARVPVIPVFLIREDGGRRLAMHVLDPVPLPDEKNDELAVYRLTATLTSIIEEQVRQWPEQWMWIHRRWKRTPETDPDPVFDPVAGRLMPKEKEENVSS